MAVASVEHLCFASTLLMLRHEARVIGQAPQLGRTAIERVWFYLEELSSPAVCSRPRGEARKATERAVSDRCAYPWDRLLNSSARRCWGIARHAAGVYKDGGGAGPRGLLPAGDLYASSKAFCAQATELHRTGACAKVIPIESRYETETMLPNFRATELYRAARVG